MIILNDIKSKEYIEKAAQIALNSKCLRSKCGCVIIKNDEIIGEGYNSPPGDEIIKICKKDSLAINFKSDKTCCIHAEQRAIIETLKKNSEKIKDSTLYFIRIDENGDKVFAGKPYCTICSKMALQVGIKEFVLLHEKGITAYDTKEYNEQSFNYKGY